MKNGGEITSNLLFETKFEMRIRPITLRKAGAFVTAHHRHNEGRGVGKFAIQALNDLGETIGVGIAGRPISRHLDDGETCEVYRVCVIDDQPNAVSFLYSAVKRVGQRMGYQKFITYTLQAESGASLRALGAKVVSEVRHKRVKWNDSGGIKRKEHKVFSQLKFRWQL